VVEELEHPALVLAMVVGQDMEVAMVVVRVVEEEEEEEVVVVVVEELEHPALVLAMVVGQGMEGIVNMVCHELEVICMLNEL
jgi:regulator of PEP synthase PpsR (kinase-PPPase family)